MTRRNKIWMWTGVVLLVYVVGAIIGGVLLKLRGGALWQFRIGLVVLGLLTAAVVYWLLRNWWGVEDDAAPAAGGLDAIFAAARTRLAQAKRKADSRLATLPTVIVLGPAASAKTTIVVRSGLEPELVAGEVFRNPADVVVAATPTANFWLTQGHVVVEAGRDVFADVPSWRRFARGLRARSLRSALTGRPQAARVAVVCLGCDALVAPGGSADVPAAARLLRSRLGELAQEIGVQLPVYVLFTKLDAIPHFDAFIRNFTADEAREVLGAAVPPDEGGAGTYSDRVTPRLEGAMEQLFRSLARRRLDVLGRENDATTRVRAYEFPRELRKLSPLLVDFLRELARPSELQVSPVLRGFYFTGISAVFVTDAVPERAPAQAARARSAVASATGVFAADQFAVAAAKPAAPQSRKVPRWNFLGRVLPEVVLADDVAHRLTGQGSRSSFWRRALIATAAAAALLYAVALGVSYYNNRDMQQDARAAIVAVDGLASPGAGLASEVDLRRLDTLRAQLDTLGEYQREGAPLSMRWGLYSGAPVYAAVRRAYFAGFDRLLMQATRPAMASTLASLPDAPRAPDDYGIAYSTLKAHLITTTNPEKSTAEFLSPVLLRAWVNGRPVDAERTTLARRQFDTYARELPVANPFSVAADGAGVGHARAFLRNSSGTERIYQFMLSEAAKQAPSVQFNRQVPGSGAYVVDSYEVPGPFTKAGWTFMQGAFKRIDQYFRGEPWVTGDVAVQGDPQKIAVELRDRYTQEYVSHWRRFLQSASVVRPGSVSDAAKKLGSLSGPQSPLLALFSTAARNTNVGTPAVDSVFQPVQTLTPGNVTDRLIGAGNKSYMDALLQLTASLEQAATARGAAGEAAAGQAAGNAVAAKTAARQIASGFTADPLGHVDGTVQDLLIAPIAYAEPMLRNFGADEINAAGQSFCARVRPILAKFPFNPDATAQASVAEVSALLKPGSGSMWTFYNEKLQTALPKQGNQFVPAAGGTLRVAPGFVTLLNRAAAFSDVLFKEDPQEPRLTLQVEPQTSEAVGTVSFTTEGQTVRSTRGGNTEQARITWTGTGRESRIAGQVGGAELSIGPFDGAWGMFRLFYMAEPFQPTPGLQRIEWMMRQGTQRVTLADGSPARIVVNVTAGPAAAILRRGYFAGAECPGAIAR